MTVKCDLEVGDTVKDKSDAVFGALAILDSWGRLLPHSAPGFTCKQETKCP